MKENNKPSTGMVLAVLSAFVLIFIIVDGTLHEAAMYIGDKIGINGKYLFLVAGTVILIYSAVVCFFVFRKAFFNMR